MITARTLSIRTPAAILPALLLSFLVLAGTAAPARAQAAPSAPAPASAPALSTPTTQLPHISITSLGQGAPVFLIPGLSSPRATFASAASTLAATHRVFLIQVNGFGGDDPGANLAPGMLDGVVADLDAYIAANHLGGAAFVGHSMGGLVGLMLAKQHPADVGRLMVIDALPYVGDLFLPGAQVAQVEPQAKMMRDQTVASYGKPANPAMAQRTANSLALHEDSRTRVAAWVTGADPRVTGEALYEDMTTDLRPALASIQTPITLVFPYSADMPQAKADAFYKSEYAAAPHVSFVAIPDSGHFVMLDQPQAFTAALTSFLGQK